MFHYRVLGLFSQPRLTQIVYRQLRIVAAGIKVAIRSQTVHNLSPPTFSRSFWVPAAPFQLKVPDSSNGHSNDATWTKEKAD